MPPCKYTIRWGGEEFLVVMPHMNRDNASVYAERLRRTVEQHNFVINDDTSINMTCSIGFAWVGVDSTAPEILFNDLIAKMPALVAANQVNILSSIAADKIVCS